MILMVHWLVTGGAVVFSPRSVWCFRHLQVSFLQLTCISREGSTAVRGCHGDGAPAPAYHRGTVITLILYLVRGEEALLDVDTEGCLCEVSKKNVGNTASEKLLNPHVSFHLGKSWFYFTAESTGQCDFTAVTRSESVSLLGFDSYAVWKQIRLC